MNSTTIRMVEISSLSPAEYNPRRLTIEAQNDLKESLSTLGIIKAIVIRKRNGRILAGHQRTKTMKLLGITECPAFCLENVSEYDEVRFNQQHNFTEVEIADDAPQIKVNIPRGSEGFVEVLPQDIILRNKGGEAGKVIMLTELITKYGQFANAVCDEEGNVIISGIYAKTIKLLRKPLWVYVLPKGMSIKAKYYFSKKYGEFNYDHIKRQTFIQSHAQIIRTPEDTERHAYKSCLYETKVIPYIKGNKNLRILDFGAGLKGYYKLLKGQGYNIDAIEFYYVGAVYKKDILTEIAEKDCMEICKHITENGLYDVVVCDSVLNSVDSLWAERCVLRTLSALCKKGGVIFWSGIPLKTAKRKVQKDSSQQSRGRGLFLDKENFTANYVSGCFYFQHYHTMETICECQKENIGNSFRVFEDGRERKTNDEFTTSSFQVVATNERVVSEQELLDAVHFEFTLPLPGGEKYALDKYIIPVLQNNMGV